MAYRPRIGLTMRLELETRRFYLGRDYSEAVEAAGGLPVHIALIPDASYLDPVVRELDGILLPGCDSDVDPALYDAEPHPKLKNVVPEKDTTDLLVLEAAERANIPVLAICYGIQVLNVSRGGTLIQDIESEVPDCVKHEQGVPRERNSHSIRIEGDGLLSALTGGEGKAMVNSHHHQALRTVGRDLRVTARASDGVIECIEDTRDERFVLGVQWHPELSWKADALSSAIFREFVMACSERRNRERAVFEKQELTSVY